MVSFWNKFYQFSVVWLTLINFSLVISIRSISWLGDYAHPIVPMRANALKPWAATHLVDHILVRLFVFTVLDRYDSFVPQQGLLIPY